MASFLTNTTIFSLPWVMASSCPYLFTDSALLSGTLRTYQRAGCDDEVVTLKCPPGTSISIEIAQYGKSAPSKSLCGIRSTPSAISRISYSYNVSCLWPSAIQVGIPYYTSNYVLTAVCVFELIHFFVCFVDIM